jgi:peptidoglycan/LPS O-acetylase OafA/YrhL
MATRIQRGLRWSARVTGLLLVGMVLLFLVGEGPPNPIKQPPSVQIEFLGMILMVAGFLAGWRWEAVGGLLAVIGFAVFAATEVIVNKRPPGGAIPLFAVPGVLYVLSYGVGKVTRRSDSP